MIEDVMLDIYSFCSLNHLKISVVYFFAEFLNSPLPWGMGHVPKILGKIPVESKIILKVNIFIGRC